MTKPIIQDLFKISVYKNILSLDSKVISNYCLELQKKDGDKIKTDKTRISTNIGGWHSNDLIGEHKPLNDLFLSLINLIYNLRLFLYFYFLLFCCQI